MSVEPVEFLNLMKQRMLFDDQDKAILQSYVDWGKEIAPEMTDCFYGFLERDQDMAQILHKSQGRMERLQKTFREWFCEMFTGIDNWNDLYAHRRWRIGLVHVKIGIGPQHVVPAMATVVREVDKRIKSDNKDNSLANSLKKICMIDLAFIEQAYVEVSSSAVLRETGWTEGLFRRLIASGANSM